MKTVERSLIKELNEHNNMHINLSVAQLVEKILRYQEGSLTSTGAIRATTGKYTGRSPEDKFIVKDEVCADFVQRRTLARICAMPVKPGL